MIRFDDVGRHPGMHSITRIILCGAALALVAAVAAAQQPSPSAPVNQTTSSDSRELVNNKDWHFIGRVEMERGVAKIYADDVRVSADTDRAIATGSVVYTQGNNRIAAERAEFNMKTQLGTFYNATGIAALQPPTQVSRPGAVVPPPVAGQDTDVYFYGETVEKIGPKKYKITNGGFTTCVQPTPRWMLTSSTVILNLEHYTLLRNVVLTVKGVPLLYTPIMVYPTKKENRATGFLLPTYGTSTLRGQSIHNAFFWAMGRSQDATFLHDWFSKTGQGAGSEYRYNLGGGDGDIRAYRLDQHESTYVLSDGSTSTLPASRSYEIRGGANQSLPAGFRARGRVSYFSSITTMQTFNTNVYDASRNLRTFGGNLVGLWNGYSLNATFDRSEYFFSTSSSAVTGSTPRLNVSRNERPLFGSALYVSLGGEYVRLVRENKAGTTSVDQSVTRFDFSPQIRFPFTRWQWFTVNSSLGWRDTYWTRSQDPNARIVDEGINRRFFTAQAQIVGPVFNRVWDTPANGYAEKFKHTIEPYVTIQRTSSIDNFKQIVQIEGTDAIVGGATQYTYGVNNRFYAKRRHGAVSLAREIVDVELTQTYYTNDQASQFDRQYATSFTGAPPSHFSPIALSVRVVPTTDVNATMRAEFDSRHRALRTISATGVYSWPGRGQATVSWSKRAFIKDLAGFNDPRFLDQYLNASTSVHTKDNRFGGIYSFSYDLLHSSLLQQRTTGFYNAQCCGIAFEYQTFNFGGVSSFAVPADRRFFLSFTLAGLGNFSPFNGAMNGVPR